MFSSGRKDTRKLATIEKLRESCACSIMERHCGSKWCLFLGIVHGFLFFAYIVVIYLGIIVGMAQIGQIGNPKDWKQMECEPLYHTVGSKKDPHHGRMECASNKREQLFWKKIHPKDGNEFFCPETVLSQSSLFCGNENDEYYQDWPIYEYGEDFINNNRTHPCWTNCDKYMDSDPEHAKYYLIVAYGFLLVLPLLQFIVLPFPHLREKVMFLFWFWCTPSDEDLPPNDVYHSFTSIMTLLYIAHILFTFSCYFFTSDTCPIIQIGHIVELCTPCLLFFLWIRHPSFTCFNIQFDSIFCLFSATLMLITIGMITELGGDCFEVSWCDTQVYFIPAWYFLALVGFPFYYLIPIWYKYKQDYEPLIIENRRKMDIIQTIDRKWQQQKDIIFPLIDRREHIWNEIWTMCWDMEKVFWQTRNEKYCDLLLAGYEGLEFPAQFHAFSSHEFCSFPAINDYLAIVDRTKPSRKSSGSFLDYMYRTVKSSKSMSKCRKSSEIYFNCMKSSKISLVSVAMLKGDINWNIYELERKLVKNRRNLRKRGRRALCTRGVRDWLPKNHPRRWFHPAKPNRGRTLSRPQKSRLVDEGTTNNDKPLNAGGRSMTGFDNLAIDAESFFASRGNFECSDLPVF